MNPTILIFLIFTAFKAILCDKFEEAVPITIVDSNPVVTINLGNPPQQFDVVISTLESITWVPSVDCTTCDKEGFEKKEEEDDHDIEEKSEDSIHNRRFLVEASTSASVTNSFQNATSEESANTSISSAEQATVESETSSESETVSPATESTSYDGNEQLFQVVQGRYNQILSSTSVDKNETVTIESTEYEVEGEAKDEYLTIGNSLKGLNFNFVSVTKVKEWSSSFGKEGILGLSYDNINGERYGLLSTLKKTGTIDKRVFAISSSQLFIGNYPTEVKQFPGKFNYCNVTLTEGLDEIYRDGWVCDLSHLLIGSSKNFSLAQEIPGRAVFDTSIKHIEAPGKFIDLFKDNYFAHNFNGKKCNQIEDDDKTVFRCEVTENVEDLSFIIGGYGLIIPGSKLFTKLENNMMQFNIIFSKKSRNLWTIGRLLLDEYLVVFDNEEGKVGFFGENKKNFLKEWTNWWNSGFSNFTSQEHFKYLIIGCVSLGAALLLVIICLVVHAFRSKSDEQTAPLGEEEEMQGRD
jgi:hypothetical protein